jgi:hypothetical protein
LLERRGARAVQGIGVPSSKSEGKLLRFLFTVCGELGGFTTYIFLLDETKRVGCIFRMHLNKPPTQTHGPSELIADG